MKTAYRFLALIFLYAAPLAAAPQPLESVSASGIEAAQLSAAGEPARLPTPASAPEPSFSRYDWSGFPPYAFTEETRVSELITRAIDRTNRTLDVALYNLQIPDTAAALIRARDRGVRVRVVLDYEHLYPKANSDITSIIQAGLDIRVMKGRGGSGSMHNKYAVFDGEMLQTGSANWSTLAETGSFENMIFTLDPALIRGYNANFEWMWSQGRLPGDQSSGWPRPAPPPAPQSWTDFNGARLPAYVFSPRGGTEEAIIRAVDAARSEVDVAMFSFTSRPIMDALTRAAGRGVKVKIMTNMRSAFPFREEVSKYRIEHRLKSGRIENGLMHNKFAVIDSALLINGSFNWSATAEELNTENTVFLKDPAYVGPFKAEFDRLFAKSVRPH